MRKKQKFHGKESLLVLNIFLTNKAMKRIHYRLFVFTMSFCFMLVTLSHSAALAATCEHWVAKAASVEGIVEAQLAGEKQWQPVKLDDTFCPGDKIRVLDNSRADLALVNQPVLRLDENSTITLGGLQEEETTLAGFFKGAAEIDLLKGAAHFFSRLPRNLMVHTAFVNAGVEGTEFFIKVAEDKTFLSIFEGKVLAANEAGSLPLTSGQSAVAESGKAPVLRVVARPRDAVRWALYYPPVIIGEGEEFRGEGELRDPRLLTNRAAMRLAVGRVDEATVDIERALSIDPNNGNAFALQSIIAVVQNEKEKALDLAHKAVEVDSKSAAPQIALSYAQQASFDLDGARASLETAVQLEPENALAWARLTEIRSSFGELDGALAAAEKATALAPNLSRTQTVLGFAYLTQVKTTEAKAAFAKAIEFDQADALPRLGMGLAKIREGDLEEGRREIEIAASLDSNSSIVRSYLGKAYYEEKRSDLGGREYAIAKELDSLDPTPLLYDAIQKQTTNRPVEALQDLQKAIELNNNRAVYRSKLLLDSDLAARSASLARIYSDLGFQQRALVEGWNSVNTDPTNYSAHRFLADSYSVLPRHEIARVSELLQSQLLQPINITPIQPQLAESNLFLISSGGDADLSFNEFNPLFNQDRVAVQASGIVGENDTTGGEAVVSGIYKNFSFSVGYKHFETVGFRINNDQKDNIANVFAQYELNYKTSIQVEYRYRDSEFGDLQLRFFKDEFMPNYRKDEERHSTRLGFRHAFAPGSDLIGNFQYTDGDRSLHNEDPDPVSTYPIFNFDLQANDDKAFSGELSYLLRSKNLNLVSGAGYFDIDSKDEITLYLEFPAPPPFVLAQFDADNDVKHTNLYAYSYIKPLENLTLTIGASYDDFNPDDDDEIKDESQFNPKFGITYSAPTGTTVRAAAFRVLKRTLITDQTLEPTQVAGFNQFFDEINATDYWLYGGALDQKFTNVFLGAEYTYRDLNVPFNDLTGPTPNLTTVDWDERIFRAYLFWTPHKWLALNAEYIYEDLDRDKNFNLNVKTVETHYLPLGINFFHPSGLSASLKGTYVNQKGSFNRLDAPLGVTEDGEDNFWLLDTAINYRFPKRYGFFTVGVKNLTDEDFEYYDSDIDNPRFQPGRVFFAKFTLMLP